MQDEKIWWKQDKLVLGVDEAGYGSLFGPMTIAGVIFPKDFDFKELPGLKDSKDLKDKKRFELEKLVKEKALWWFCDEISPQIIDQETGFHAKYRIAGKTINQYQPVCSTVVIMDGNRKIEKLDPKYQSECLIKGDSLCKTISAASILAKCAQRRFIIKVSDQYQEYQIGKNNGYWSKPHKEAILKLGPTEFHRRTYIGKILAEKEKQNADR